MSIPEFFFLEKGFNKPNFEFLLSGWFQNTPWLKRFQTDPKRIKWKFSLLDLFKQLQNLSYLFLLFLQNTENTYNFLNMLSHFLKHKSLIKNLFGLYEPIDNWLPQIVNINAMSAKRDLCQLSQVH